MLLIWPSTQHNSQPLWSKFAIIKYHTIVNGDKNHEHIPSDTILLVDKHPVNYGSEKNPNHQEKRPLDSPGPTGPPDRARKGPEGPRAATTPSAHQPTSGPLRAHGPTAPTGPRAGPTGLRARTWGFPGVNGRIYIYISRYHWWGDIDFMEFHQQCTDRNDASTWSWFDIWPGVYVMWGALNVTVDRPSMISIWYVFTSNDLGVLIWFNVNNNPRSMMFNGT